MRKGHLALFAGGKKENQQAMRILIVNNNMHIGGVQKALLNLIREIHQTHDVTLLLLHKGGELLGRIPGDVAVLEASSPLRFYGMSAADARNKAELAQRSFWAALTRVLGRGVACRLAALPQPVIEGYDVALSFLHSGNPKAFYGGCAEFVLSSVDAGRKVCFLHNDYRQIHAASNYNKRLYASFDAIAACSQGCRDAFLEVMPELSGKMAIVRNCVGYAEVRKLAASGAPMFAGKLAFEGECAPEGKPALDGKPALEHDCMNVVTVARLGREKGVLRAIRVVSRLREEGLSLRYYVVGTGVEQAFAQALVGELGLEEHVRLLGEQENPYPLMAACDLLLVPSYAEAAPLVVGEAASLGTPVLSTNTSSAVEMIEDTGYGWVCENTEEGIYQALSWLARTPSEVLARHGKLCGMVFSDSAALADFDANAVGGSASCER